MPAPADTTTAPTPAPDVYEWAIGSTFELDAPRMARQLRAVLRVMLTASTQRRWLTLEELREVLEHRGVKASTASLSARLRDLRRPGILGELEPRPLDVKRRRRKGDRLEDTAAFEYLVVPPDMPGYSPSTRLSPLELEQLKEATATLRKALKRAGVADEVTVATLDLELLLEHGPRS